MRGVDSGLRFTLQFGTREYFHHSKE